MTKENKTSPAETAVARLRGVFQERDLARCPLGTAMVWDGPSGQVVSVHLHLDAAGAQALAEFVRGLHGPAQ